jgi:tryptophanyl-tRNA synthetase
MKKIFLTGIQPSGRPHLGNYFGTMMQLVDRQDSKGEYDIRAIIVDMHAMTSVQDGRELAQNSLDLAIDYLAIGLDPKNVLIFKQSDMPEVTEMSWVFSCITTVPFLSLAHSYKDKVARGKEASVGLFTYPLLMAADILIHNSDIVPVGKDQRQHVEMARDIAEKFNRVYCTDKGLPELFRLPAVQILSEVETVPGIDGHKMSKSYNNHIPLFSTDDEIRRLVMSIVTDSGAAADIESGKISGIPENVYNIHKLVWNRVDRNKGGARGIADAANKNPYASIDDFYKENKGKYKILKDALIADLIAFIAPLRDRRAKIAANPAKIKKMLSKNGEKARKLTAKLVKEFRERVGFTL